MVHDDGRLGSHRPAKTFCLHGDSSWDCAVSSGRSLGQQFSNWRRGRMGVLSHRLRCMKKRLERIGPIRADPCESALHTGQNRAVRGSGFPRRPTIIVSAPQASRNTRNSRRSRGSIQTTIAPTMPVGLAKGAIQRGERGSRDCPIGWRTHYTPRQWTGAVEEMNVRVEIGMLVGILPIGLVLHPMPL